MPPLIARHLSGGEVCAPGVDHPPATAGQNPGGIYLAAYGAGSVFAYHELIVVSALVRRGRRLGVWVSHIYIDNPRSVAGGREIWGLPKEFAAFTWHGPSGPAVVRQGGRLLCTLRPSRQPPLARLPVFLPAFGWKEGELMWFRGTGTAQLGVTRAEINVPPRAHSPLWGSSAGSSPVCSPVRPPVRLTRR